LLKAPFNVARGAFEEPALVSLPSGATHSIVAAPKAGRARWQLIRTIKTASIIGPVLMAIWLPDILKMNFYL
jgi:hypothetical protein